jgi:hypothetical protein
MNWIKNPSNFKYGIGAAFLGGFISFITFQRIALQYWKRFFNYELPMNRPGSPHIRTK